MVSMGSGMATASTFGRTAVHRSGGVYESGNGTKMRYIGAGVHANQATVIGNPTSTPAWTAAPATPLALPVTTPVKLPPSLTANGRMTGRVSIAHMPQDVAQSLVLKISGTEVEIPDYGVKIPVSVQQSANETVLKGVHLNNATRATFELDMRLTSAGALKTMTLRHDGGGSYDPNWRPQFTFKVE